MKRLSISVLTLVAMVPAMAQAQDTLLDEIVVTANRIAAAINRIGVSVSVVSEADLQKSSETTVAGYLSRLPGVALVAQGPFGNTGNLRIRGADGRYLAVFIDGVRVSDPSSTTVQFDFGSLLTTDVGRIEVLRGSQSALWGGSAVGGVINITTREATEEGFHQTAKLEGGSYGTTVLAYGLTQKSGPLELALNAGALHTDGYSAAAAGTERDGADAERLSFSAKYQVSDALALGASGFTQRVRQDYDGYAAPTYLLGDANSVQRKRETGARVFADYKSGNSDHLFDATLFRVNRGYDQGGDLSGFVGKRLALSYKGATEISQALTMVYGLDWQKESAEYTNLPGGVADNKTAGIYAQALWAPREDLDISTSLRMDHNDGFGDFSTGRLALAYRPDAATTVRASVATGFRAPSIDERFGDYPGYYAFVGNPDLTPEKSLSYELGVEHEFGTGARVSATVFQLNVDDLVTYVFGSPSTLVNLPGKSKRSGVELAAEVPINDRVSLTAAYTYTDARNPAGGRLVQVPYHDLSLGVAAKLSDKLSAEVNIKAQAGRWDNDPNTFTAGPMPDFGVVNLAVRYAISDQAEAYVKIDNLLDKDYQLINGYSTSGRAIYVGLQAKF